GGAVFLPVHAVFGHVRVQLERMPPDSHIPLPSAGGDSLLQPTLADVAPRANHVRNHVHGQCHDPLSFPDLAFALPAGSIIGVQDANEQVGTVWFPRHRLPTMSDTTAVYDESYPSRRLLELIG